MGRRRRAREHALQMLFQIDLTESVPTEVFKQFWAAHEADLETKSFAQELVLGVIGGRAELDRFIRSAAENWRIERMAVVDRNVLRMAIYEMQHQPDTPPAVVIDEAIEVARKFGTEESGSFINGILDAVRRSNPDREPEVGDVTP